MPHLPNESTVLIKYTPSSPNNLRLTLLFDPYRYRS
nr:MAG TPA: hypothetical protein [Caudoviricetes sp.]